MFSTGWGFQCTLAVWFSYVIYCEEGFLPCLLPVWNHAYTTQATKDLPWLRMPTVLFFSCSNVPIFFVARIAFNHLAMIDLVFAHDTGCRHACGQTQKHICIESTHAGQSTDYDWGRVNWKCYLRNATLIPVVLMGVSFFAACIWTVCSLYLGQLGKTERQVGRCVPWIWAVATRTNSQHPHSRATAKNYFACLASDIFCCSILFARCRADWLTWAEPRKLASFDADCFK